MVSQDMSLEYVSDRAKGVAFSESVVQYLRGEIRVPLRGFPKPLRSKVLKYRKIDLVEGRPGDELGEYKFDKAAEELRSKYGSSKISNKDVLVNWKDYKAV